MKGKEVNEKDGLLSYQAKGPAWKRDPAWTRVFG